jgi:hypothetical protein
MRALEKADTHGQRKKETVENFLVFQAANNVTGSDSPKQANSSCLSKECAIDTIAHVQVPVSGTVRLLKKSGIYCQLEDCEQCPLSLLFGRTAKLSSNIILLLPGNATVLQSSLLCLIGTSEVPDKHYLLGIAGEFLHSHIIIP